MKSKPRAYSLSGKKVKNLENLLEKIQLTMSKAQFISSEDDSDDLSFNTALEISNLDNEMVEKWLE